MLKVMFIPFRALSGIFAGALARRLFERVWGLIAKEQAPDPEQRQISIGKLAAALALEGALFSAVRGLVDHGSRQAFTRLTGRWPGKARPEPEEG